MSETPPLVYAVVLAWNQLQETRECLESLACSDYPNLRLLVVDNGSTDGTSEIIPREFPQVDVTRLEQNGGVTQGYNRGIEVALQNGADYVMPMNNDTVVHPKMVSELVKTFEDRPKTGMAAPKIYHYYGDQKRLWCVGAKWVSFPPRVKLIGSDAADGPNFNRVFPLEYATSCCLLISKEAAQRAGLFDTNYFLYFDDWDISERYRANGYDILFVPSAHLWHKVSVSTQKSEKSARSWYFFGKSTVRFYLLYKSPAILGLHVTWFLMRETAKLKFKRLAPYLFGVAGGLADNWGWKQ
jgi:GT2 family glycosyltransferase